MALILFQQIGIMFFIIVVGAVFYKLRLISKEGNRDLSNMLLYLTNPIVIFLAYQQEFSAENFKYLCFFIVLSLVSYAILIPVVNLLVGKKNPEYAIERFSAVYCNAGFFGIPLIESLFGLEGVFYLTAYLTAFNIFVWSHGVMVMKGQKGDVPVKEKLIASLKSMVNPTLLACIAGFVLYVLGIMLPDICIQGLQYVGNMNTPLAMIIAGVALAQSDLKKVLANKRIYYVAFIRLVLSPVLTIALLWFLPIPEILKVILVIVKGCPVGATCTMLAIRYGKDDAYASSIYVVTTVLSLVTLPVIMLLFQ